VTRYVIRLEDGSSSIVEAEAIVSFDERAHQYLSDRSLAVLYADDERLLAMCRGSSKNHLLGFDQDRGWWCSCRIPADCPHLIALKIVARTPGEKPPVEAARELARTISQAKEAFLSDPMVERLRDRAATADRLERDRTELTERLRSESQAELDRVRQERSAIVGRLERELAQAAAAASSADTEAGINRARASALEREIRGLKERVDSVGQLEKSASDAQDEARELRKRLSDSNTAKAQLEAELRSAGRVGRMARELRRRLAESERRMELAQAELDAALERSARAEELRAGLAQRDELVNELGTKAAEQLSQISRLSGQIAESEMRAGELEMEIQALRASIGVAPLSFPVASPERTTAAGKAPRTGSGSNWIERALEDLPGRNGRGGSGPNGEVQGEEAAEPTEPRSGDWRKSVWS